MHQIHPNARTTPAVRAEIARSSEPSGVLAHRFGGKRPFGARLPSRPMAVLGRSGAAGFRTTLWIALATTRRVSAAAGSRF